MEIFENFQANIEANEVDHFEGAHRMIQAELDGFVDVGGGGDASFEHRERFVSDERIDARCDEAWGFVDDYGLLAHAGGDGNAGGNGFVGGLRRADDFDQLHFGDRVEEMHPDAAVPVEDNVAEIADGKRGSVAGEDGVGLRELGEDREQLELDFEFFGNGFDDEVGVAGGFVEADDYLGAADQQRAADQVGSLRHELDRLGAHGRIFGHVAFAVEIVAGVQEEFVIANADEFVEFRFRQRLFVQIAGVKVEFQFEQETSCFAASGSSGLLVKDGFRWHVS